MPEIIIQLGDNIIHKYSFDKEIISIGRARDNDIVIENLSVSRNHARIRKVDGKYIITDLNSANGTFVNGVQITKTELENNDSVSIGKHKLTFINKLLTDEQIISDAFGADRTMIVDKTPTACLIVNKGRQKDQEFKVVKYETFIGRAAENDIRLHDWFVSKKHAEVIRQGSSFFIKDLGSWRGMKVNGKQIKEVELKDGDEIEFGTTTLLFRSSLEGDVEKGTGRVPKELSVDDSVSSQEPIHDDVSDDEIAKAMASSDSEDFDFEQEAELDEMEEIEEIDEELDEEEELEEEELEEEEIPEELESEDELDELEEIEITGEEEIEDELSFEEKLQNAEKESEGMMMGFEKVEDSELDEKQTADEELQEKIPAVVEQVVQKKEAKPADASAGAPKTKEIEMWEKALQNKSSVIRKQAAQMLKKLTGKDYDYE